MTRAVDPLALDLLSCHLYNQLLSPERFLQLWWQRGSPACQPTDGLGAWLPEACPHDRLTAKTWT